MTALAQSGLVIDRQIDIMGYDAYETMLTRRLYGYTWVPSALQMITFSPPGFALTKESAYDPDHPPAGSILVHDPNTFDIATWFPPFDPWRRNRNVSSGRYTSSLTTSSPARSPP